MGPFPNPRGLGQYLDPNWLGFGSFGVQTQGVWVLPCPNPRGLGDGSVSGSKRVGVCVLQWPDPRGLGPFASGPKGVVSVRVHTKGVGSLSGPKRVGVWVLRSTNAWGVGSDGVGTQGGWLMGSCLDPRGLGPCPDPIGLGFASVVGPKGVGDGAMSEP